MHEFIPSTFCAVFWVGLHTRTNSFAIALNIHTRTRLVWRRSYWVIWECIRKPSAQIHWFCCLSTLFSFCFVFLFVHLALTRSKFYQMIYLISNRTLNNIVNVEFNRYEQRRALYVIIRLITSTFYLIFVANYFVNIDYSLCLSQICHRYHCFECSGRIWSIAMVFSRVFLHYWKLLLLNKLRNEKSQENNAEFLIDQFFAISHRNDFF